ncbi:MAG: thiamine-phosphate kinase [Euryarchaeota archaeon]|nr:thiamine-phosphate kinase [Euryarchaeota archaeon]
MNEAGFSISVKKLSDLGERNAIRLIETILSKGDAAVGIGDDCAAFAIGDEYLLVTTDMITQKTHIPKGMMPYQIGWFVVAINLSDIAAKGGRPLGLVLALGLPKNTSELFLKELLKGADACATRFDTSIVGGDTKGNSEITICGTAFGLVKKDEFIPRKGGKIGDVVAVTGSLGKAGAGYLASTQRIRDTTLLKGLFEPIPRIREGRILASLKVVSSCMDISDGLSSSLYQLRDLNQVGFEIYSEKLPIASELLQLKKRLTIDVTECAVHFGGDYELLLTISSENFEKARRKIEKIGLSLTVIGKVTKNKEIIMKLKNKKKILENKGYEHFKKNDY